MTKTRKKIYTVSSVELHGTCTLLPQLNYPESFKKIACKGLEPYRYQLFAHTAKLTNRSTNWVIPCVQLLAIGQAPPQTGAWTPRQLGLRWAGDGTSERW